MRRILVMLLVATSVVATGAYPAAAKGSALTPVRDRYEPRDVATLVGYTGGPQLLSNRPPGPYRALLEDQEGRFKIGVAARADRHRT